VYQSLTDFHVLYHRLSGNALKVYDIQVEDVPEFYANGILVHNCPICGPLHNKIVELDQSWDFTEGIIQGIGGENEQKALRNALKSSGRSIRRPPAHVNCRCYLQPVIFETMSEEEIQEQRFG